MNFLKFVVTLALCCPLLCLSGDLAYDHETLKTSDGKTFHDISVLGSDTMGLTFRHRDGIAKVDFTSLSEAYRMLYEGVADLPEADAEKNEAPHSPVEASILSLDEDPVQLVARNRVVIEIPRSFWHVGGGIDYDWRSPAWPVWWPDHRHVHRLTHPLYRELALRDFLLQSGLLPYPGCRG